VKGKELQELLARGGVEGQVAVFLVWLAGPASSLALLIIAGQRWKALGKARPTGIAVNSLLGTEIFWIGKSWRKQLGATASHTL
jgi:hypothetical protein